MTQRIIYLKKNKKWKTFPLLRVWYDQSTYICRLFNINNCLLYTSASIDPENEHLIQQAISELTIGKTVIVIAHRLATIEHADQILVVDKGQVVQKGTHQQLVQQEGLYRRFITIREQAEGWSIAWCYVKRISVERRCTIGLDIIHGRLFRNRTHSPEKIWECS